MSAGPTDDDWKKITKLVDQFYNRADAEPFRAPVDWKNLGLSDYPKIITNPMDLGTIKNRLRSKKKDAPRHYKNLLQVSKDVHQVWTNCTLYNADGSDFYKLATSLRKKWEDRFKKVLSECSPGARGGGEAAAAAAASSTKKSAPTPDKSKPSSSSAAAGAAQQAAAGVTNSTLYLDISSSMPPASANNAAAKTTIQDRRVFAKSLYSLTKEDLGKVLVELEVKCPAAMRRNSAEDEVELNIDKISPPSVFIDLKEMIDHFVVTTSAQRKTNKSGGGASSKKAKTK